MLYLLQKTKTEFYLLFCQECQVIEIKPDSRENIIKHLIDLDIPNEAAAIISYLSNDFR